MHLAATTSGTPRNRTLGHCDLPYDEDRLPLVFLYSLVLLVGLPANLLTVLLTWVQVRRNNVLAVYLWSLSLCDLTYLCTLPLWALYISRSHRWSWSSLACKATSYIFFTNMYVSIFLLCCISYDRYVAVVYALESRGLRRQRLAIAIIVAIVAAVALGHIPVFSMQEGDAAEGEGRCFEPGRSTATVTGFNYARFLVGFLLPLVLLVISNRAVLLNVQASAGLQPQQKRRVRYLAVAVVLLFLVCFAPYHLILLLRAVAFHLPLEHRGCHLEQWIYAPYTISLGLSTFNSAINPILYVLSSNNVRKELAHGLLGLCGRSRRPSSNSSQNNMHLSNNDPEAAGNTQQG